ncbi:MAG: hypothetical protein AABX08_01555 [Nanoarchaeota archaeon]
METKAIKISKKNYEWLCQEAGKLQTLEKKSVSIDDALTYLHKRVKNKLSDFAGTWKMSDREAEVFMEDLRKGWKKWKIESV